MLFSKVTFEILNLWIVQPWDTGREFISGSYLPLVNVAHRVSASMYSWNMAPNLTRGHQENQTLKDQQQPLYKPTSKQESWAYSLYAASQILSCKHTLWVPNRQSGISIQWQQGSHWKEVRGTWHESKTERYLGLNLNKGQITAIVLDVSSQAGKGREHYDFSQNVKWALRCHPSSEYWNLPTVAFKITDCC